MTIDNDKANKRNELELQSELGNQDDRLVSRRLKSILQLLSHGETPQPGFAIDRSIIAAANRDAIRPARERSYQISWWRKVSLPLYISAGFVFTVVAYKNLWPEPLQLIQGVDKSVIVQDISLEIDNSEGSSATNGHATEISSKLLPKLTKLTQLPAELSRTEDEQFKPRIESIQANINLSDDTVDKTESQVFTGNQLVKAKYPERDSWVRKIIEQMRTGQFEQARSELRDFKEIYPNHPIEEQIKLLNQ